MLFPQAQICKTDPVAYGCAVADIHRVQRLQTAPAVPLLSDLRGLAHHRSRVNPGRWGRWECLFNRHGDVMGCHEIYGDVGIYCLGLPLESAALTRRTMVNNIYPILVYTSYSTNINKICMHGHWDFHDKHGDASRNNRVLNPFSLVGNKFWIPLWSIISNRAETTTNRQ